MTGVGGGDDDDAYAAAAPRLSRRTVVGVGTALLGGLVTGCSGSPPAVVDGPSGGTDPHRPGFHYTAADGRLADPNGLILVGRDYHLFHQSDGRWAHAVSPDLVHWSRQPVALDHDEDGQALSGSAVLDPENRSGLLPNGGVAALYTNTTGGEAQSLAVSPDGTGWTRYRANPVLPNDGRKDFRDPKVIWHEATRRWVMAVSVGEEVEFFGSEDLVRWNALSRFGAGRGLHSAVWECPGLVELTIEGSSETAWVLYVSVGDSEETDGSTVQYFVGAFDGTTFTGFEAPETVRIVDHGQDFYAAQTWFGLPDRRQVWIAWLGNWRYPYELPTAPWKGAMSVPRELTLARSAGGLRLRQRAVRELESLRGPGVEDSGPVTGVRWLDLASDSLEFELELRPGPGRSGLRVLADDQQWVEIGVDRSAGTLYVDRSRSAVTSVPTRDGGVFDLGRPRSAPVAGSDRVRLHGFVDRSTVEVFEEGGAVLSVVAFGAGAGRCAVFSDGGAAQVDSLVVRPMAGIWG